jgi:predicted GTPase
MSQFNTLNNLWQNIREADLRPMREQALRGVHIAIVGAPGSGRSTLADQMRRDPHRPQLSSDAPVMVLDLASASTAQDANLIILMVDARRPDASKEQELIYAWQNSGKRVLVFVNQFNGESGSETVSPWTSRGSRRVVVGSKSSPICSWRWAVISRFSASPSPII